MKTLQERCSLFLPWEDLTLFNTDKWQSLQEHWIASYLFFFFFLKNWLIRFHESFQNWKTMKIEVEKFPPLKGKWRNIAYQETFTSDSIQALFSGFRMVGLTSRAAFTLITGLALQRKYPFQQHSAPR